MKSVALHNLGCKVNGYEMDVMQQMLREKDYKIVPFDERADIYIVNTCTVTNIADRKSRQMLHRARKMNPEAVVVAVGCYVQTDSEKALTDAGIDLVIGNNKKKDLIPILEEYLAEKKANSARASQDKTLGGKTIVDISRAFLDTNGAHQEASVILEIPGKEGNPFADRKDIFDVTKKWLDTLANLNVCSQKGLVEMFDGSIGAGSVFMPYGGKYQLTETQAMVAKLPVLKGKTDTVTMMSYGFDPYLSSWSPYHGAIYAVTESMAKIVANGGDYRTIRFTFQEYFRRMSEEASRWSQPFAALLGAYDAQIGYGLPSIGGKDSMSGTFNDIDVPPTLVSFAVDVARSGNIITPELKKAGNKLVRFKIEKDDYDIPVYEKVMALYEKITELIQKGVIV